MDEWDWVVYFVLLILWTRSAIRTRKLVKALNEEGRQFGSFGFGIFAVLFLPWAMRKAEKDYVEEQEKIRREAK